MFDFKVSNYNGEPHLSFVVQEAVKDGIELRSGAGIILDNTYTLRKTVLVNSGIGVVNMHEFSLLDHGQRALLSSDYEVFYDLDTVSVAPMSAMINNPIFQEIDVESGHILFEWRALDYLAPSLSMENPPSSRGKSWDWLLVFPSSASFVSSSSCCYYCCSLSMS